MVASGSDVSCTAPETYYKVDPEKNHGKGGLTKDARKALVNGSTITVACGKCIQCRLAYARSWALRCMHEVKTSGDGIFVTLTYRDEDLPGDWNLDYRHFQLFMHKLRKRLAGAGRFLMCGEYGDEYGRPHYHAILFNCRPPDMEFYKTIDGNRFYTSEIIQELWPHGFVTIGDVTLDSAGYVARYSLKKVSGPQAGSAYQFVSEDGEVFDRDPPFLRSSLRPGIGYEWFQRYHMDVFPCDYLVYDGRKFPVPRYYSKLMERLDGASYERIVKKRKRSVVERKGHIDNTPRRLATRNHHDVLVSKNRRDLK